MIIKSVEQNTMRVVKKFHTFNFLYKKYTKNTNKNTTKTVEKHLWLC